MRRYIFNVVGKDLALYYGILCLLSVAIISALYLSSVYGLQAYVSEQVEKQPWDAVANQTGSIKPWPELQARYRAVEGVERAEVFGMLRAQNGVAVEVRIDGQEVPVRWIVIAAASDPQVLLPALRNDPVVSENGHVSEGLDLVKATLIGTDSGIVLEPGATLEIRSIPLTGHVHGPDGEELGGSIGPPNLGVHQPDEHEHADDGHQHEHELEHADDVTRLFQAQISNTPAQIDRQTFNRWILGAVGSLSYMPERSLILTVSMQAFEDVSAKLEGVFFSTEGLHGVQRSSPYIPEVSHLLSLDRDTYISTWDLRRTLAQLEPALTALTVELRDFSMSGNVNSDIFALFARMADIQDALALVTLMVAIPLLWLAWITAQLLSRLLFMNARRKIGLLMIRGIPSQSIGRILLVTLVFAGFFGGLVGLVAGVGTSVGAYSLMGRPLPPASVLYEGVFGFSLFLLTGIALALFAGQSMIKKVKEMTPRQAIARVADFGLETAEPVTKLSAFAASACFLIGLYKIVGWILGYSLILWLLAPIGSKSLLGAIGVFETLLNFIAVPLFIGGLLLLLRWRAAWFQVLIGSLSWPLVGRLRWYVGKHLAVSRYRISASMFITALAVAMTVLPQIAADTFYDRILRGVSVAVGGDFQLTFNMANLTNGRDHIAELHDYRDLIHDNVEDIQRRLLAKDGVTAVVPVEQFLLHSVYLPTQSGLALNLIERPSDYLKLVSYGERLGLTRSFSEIFARLGSGPLVTSQGFRQVRMVPRESDVILGYYERFEPVTVQFDDVLAFLPGQPMIEAPQREGFAAAEVDYLNYMTRSDARVIAAAEQFQTPPLSRINVAPSSVVFLGRTNREMSQVGLERLVSDLPIQPQNVRSEEAERRQVSRDMFISLALENMKVFMIGGLAIALSGIVVIGLANFAAERRTLSLLRLRGTPVSMLVRISLSIFLVPVLVGVALGILLGLISGYGIAQAIWELPRVYGVAGFLSNQLVFSSGAATLLLVFSIVLSGTALGFALWPVHKTAREAVTEG